MLFHTGLSRLPVRWLSVLAVVVLGLLSPAGWPAQVQSLASLKAAYIFNLAKFTRWPDSRFAQDNSPLRLCVYGDDDVTQALNSLKGRSVGGHPIAVEYPRNENDFANCHLLYVTESERRAFRYLLALLSHSPVLTISSDRRFLRDGGLVHLTEQQRKLRFAVNMQQLDQSGLKLSSKLLRLAILVEKPGRY